MQKQIHFLYLSWQGRRHDKIIWNRSWQLQICPKESRRYDFVILRWLETVPAEPCGCIREIFRILSLFHCLVNALGQCQNDIGFACQVRVKSSVLWRFQQIFCLLSVLPFWVTWNENKSIPGVRGLSNKYYSPLALPVCIHKPHCGWGLNWALAAYLHVFNMANQCMVLQSWCYLTNYLQEGEAFWEHYIPPFHSSQEDSKNCVSCR